MLIYWRIYNRKRARRRRRACGAAAAARLFLFKKEKRGGGCAALVFSVVLTNWLSCQREDEIIHCESTFYLRAMAARALFNLLNSLWGRRPERNFFPSHPPAVPLRCASVCLRRILCACLRCLGVYVCLIIISIIIPIIFISASSVFERKE